jgi:cobaltochelatase CobS
MPVFNGKTVSVEAHRIALQIQTLTGVGSLNDSIAVDGQLRVLLRQYYVATGGKRGSGAGCYNPTSRELRRIYNGDISGAELLKAAVKTGYAEPSRATPKAGDDIVLEEPPETEALKALQSLLGGQKVNPEAVRKIAMEAVDGRVGEVMSSMATLIADEVAKQVRTVEVKIAEMPTVKLDKTHMCFDRILRFAANRKNVMIIGPAGSGKTFIAEQIAKTLGLEFYFSGRCVDEVKLLGYMDGGGTYRTTQFRQAYEFGGVFLADEMDAWAAEALVALNAPLAGQWGDFPDAKVQRHPDFIVIAAANTFGRGADRLYVGREQLDAASLDRFAVVNMDYDENLELAICNDAHGNLDWVRFVQKVRGAIEKEKVRAVVSPRASIEGGIMLKAGDSRADVEESYVWKGMEERVRNQIKAAMR